MVLSGWASSSNQIKPLPVIIIPILVSDGNQIKRAIPFPIEMVLSGAGAGVYLAAHHSTLPPDPRELQI